DAIERGDALFSLLRFSFESLVVLEVRLERRGVDGVLVKQVAVDEVLDSPDQLEIEPFDDEPVERLRQRAEALPELFAIAAGVGKYVVTRPQRANRGPQILLRADNVAVSDRRHVFDAQSGEHEEGTAYARVALRRVDDDSAREAFSVVVDESKD